MPDNEAQPIEHSEGTKGKITAFRQILEEISKKQQDIPNRISSIKGETRAFVTMAEYIQGLITQRIHKLSALGLDKERIKDEQEFALSIKKLCEKRAQESINEKLRIEGEARALLLETEVIATLSKKAIIDEQTLQALEVQQDGFRNQLARPNTEQSNPEESPKSKSKPKRKRPSRAKKKEEKKEEKKEVEEVEEKKVDDATA